MDIYTIERDQERAISTLDAEVQALDGKVAAVDPQLPEHVRQDRILSLRSASAEKLREIRAAIQNGAAQAKALTGEYSPETVRRRARFHADNATNASMQLATATRLAKTPTGELLHHLADAVAENAVAMAEAIRLEFSARPDAETLRIAFGKKLEELPTPAATSGTEAVARVLSKAGLAEERLTAAVTGRRNPIARLEAAHLARVA